MDTNDATTMFDALSQDTRLRAFRLLVRAGPEGLPAGALSGELGIPHNTLSFHLGHLARAGLVGSRKAGRSVIYSARFEAMSALIGFMVKDCCSDDLASFEADEATGCAVIRLAACCPPQPDSESTEEKKP